MRKHSSGFTLIELLVSISIIAMLIGILAPHITKSISKAQATKCLNNLRQLAVAVNLYAADNDGRFPLVESMPSDEVYQDVEGLDPKPMFETFSPYGLTKESLKCPADVAALNYFAQEGSSYQWRNMVDGELASAPKIYGRRGIRVPRSTWLVIATDYDTVHGGRSNRLYADGHVKRADDNRR